MAVRWSALSADTFKCLGSIITSRNEIEYDIKDKIAAAIRCFHALNKTLSKRYICKGTKIRTYRTVTGPVILYSCENWTLIRKIASTLMTWERNILRKI
jgi:hypothetical protein